MKLSNMAAALRKHGLTVVETPGWAGRGYAPPGEGPRDLIEVRGVLWHHTATNRSRFNVDAPTLQMCVDGRWDVAGPLCNIVFGRNGTVYLVAAGLANHAGAGAAPNIPRDLGNYYLIGIEMESSGIAPWDWTADQLRVAPYLGAALEQEYLGHLPAELRLQLGHKEYSSMGKIDPAGWPGDMDGLRASINKVLGGSGPAPVVPASSTPVVKPPVKKPAPKPAPKAPARSGLHWVVQRGDTLGKIAAYYNGPSVAQIAAYNGIKNVNKIKPGQKVYIPGPLVWIVDPGNTLGGIAAYYGMTAETVAANNGLNVNAPIYPGQRLRII